MYLQSAVNEDDKNWKDDEVCDKVKTALFLRVLNGQKATISKTKPESNKIIRELLEHGSASTSRLIDATSNKEKMDKTISP